MFTRIGKCIGLLGVHFNCHVETEGLLKVTGSHVRCSSVSETRKIETLLLRTTRHNSLIGMIYGLSNRTFSHDFE